MIYNTIDAVDVTNLFTSSETLNVPISTQEQVWQSYQRCRNSADFFDSFYDNFARKSPEIGALFSRTDMERQNQLLNSAIENLIRFAEGEEAAKEKIDALGHSHGSGGYQIKQQWYTLWEEAMLETIQENDPQCTPELLKLWSEILEPGIRRIIDLY